MKEIRIHGRGGQGAVTTSEIIVYAAVQDGKFGACFPYFGFEKKGGPVSAFVRIDEKKIREKNQVYNPDCIMVIDPTLLNSVDVFAGAKEDSILVINTKSIEGIEIPKNITKVAYVDANSASMDIFGRLLPNTIVLGAFIKATNWVSFDKVSEKTQEIWGPKNLEALEYGFNNVTILDVNAESDLVPEITSRKHMENGNELDQETSNEVGVNLFKTEFICAIGKELNIINTGDWKVYPPVIQQDKCRKCAMCLLYCPTKSVKLIDGNYHIDLEFCKGCGVCINECPAKAIEFIKGE